MKIKTQAEVDGYIFEVTDEYLAITDPRDQNCVIHLNINNARDIVEWLSHELFKAELVHKEIIKPDTARKVLMPSKPEKPIPGPEAFANRSATTTVELKATDPFKAPDTESADGKQKVFKEEVIDLASEARAATAGLIEFSPNRS